MSTRCNIIIKGRGNERVYLYHHHDGYPEGVGQDLAKLLAEPLLIGRVYATPVVNHLVKNTAGLNDDEYEVTMGLHGDIDYCYVVNCKTNSLRCFKVTDKDVDTNTYEPIWKRVFTRRNLVKIPGYDMPFEKKSE